MSDSISIATCGRVVGRVRPPGSKSITNRALICAALANGRSILTGALASEDTHVMIDSLQRLGIQVRNDASRHVLEVDGCGGRIPSSKADLFVANSGTTIRFLTAMVATGQGEYRLDGIERMRQRPIADLIDALKELGVDIQSELGTGAPPVLVRTKGLRGGTCRVRGDVSSQFLSGLLMAAPYAQSEVTVELSTELVSRPYIAITLNVSRAFGAQINEVGRDKFVVPTGHHYVGREYAIEPDASAASYFWAAAAITGGDVTVTGLTRGALQGDVGFVEVLEKMGCQVEYGRDYVRVVGGELRGIDVDMNSISDTVQTLAAVALFAQGPTRVRNVAHNRHKETDRIRDLATELRRLGAEVEEFEDGLEIHPGNLKGASVETYNDHRMAMSLALVGLRIPGVVVLNPKCTEKTYPEYFEDLSQLVATGSAGFNDSAS